MSTKRAKPKGIAAQNKRRKQEELAEALAGSPLADAVLAPPAAAAAQAAFAGARPLRHVVLEQVCREDRLRAAFQQAVQGLSADLHESDTAKLYQSSLQVGCDCARAHALVRERGRVHVRMRLGACARLKAGTAAG